METNMTGRIPASLARIAATIFAAAAVLGVTAGAASAEPELIYSNFPTPTPPNVVSQPFEASGSGQFGGTVEFAGLARKGPSVFVEMSSWACQSGSWTGSPECITTMGAKFEWPVTLNINQVGPGNTVGPLIGSITKTFKMPYRPSQNNKRCTGTHAGAYYVGTVGECFHGKLFKIFFTLSKVTLPAKAILSVAYNTSDFGTEPQRPKSPACEPNCPYDSLNVGLTEPPNELAPTPVAPSVGTDPQPADAYHNSAWSGNYCDGGAGGTGTFRLDAGCWTGYQPLFAVKAH
jgi:hypothetical protein